ncbi:hypothetical protein GOODEAATRI_028638 [Goodea atripinnis]|uniref:Uncharacterized protein n=1 Tax=Goodea atripinnis TaxID=208336 RepID=A0ABV0Q1T2_9TELE
MRRPLQLNPKGNECQRTSSSLVNRMMRWNMSFQKLSHGRHQLNCQVHQIFFKHLAPIPKQMILARKLFYQQENHEMMMDQMKIIFTTVQGLKSATEEDIGVEPYLLPLADPQSVENLEERLRNSPDLKNQQKNGLALKGGGDIKECVKRLMAATLTHALAKNMNM